MRIGLGAEHRHGNQRLPQSFTVTTAYNMEPFVLAPEICDHIIDHLCYDKSALSVCALVHRTWTPSAHLHLFYRVDIICDDQENSKNPSGILQPYIRGILPLIQDLRIVALRSDPPVFPELPKLPALKHLTVTCAKPWEQIPETGRQWFIEHVKMIHTLRIRMEFQEFENSLYLIASARLIKVMDIHYHNPQENPKNMDSGAIFAQHIPPSVQNLGIAFNGMPKGDGDHPGVSLLQWLEYHNKVDKLSNFRVVGTWTEARDWQKVARWIDETATQLQHLGFDGPEFFSQYIDTMIVNHKLTR